MSRGFEVGVALRDQGMTLALSRSGSLVALLQPFKLGQRGETGSRMVRSLVESSAESEQLIWMMDYSYWASDGSRRRLWDQTVVLIERADVDLPHFHLSKETMFQWAEKLFKQQEIDFLEHPRFSKLFQLKGEDESAVRALFTLKVREGLEQHPGLTIEGGGSQLLVFRDNVVVPPDKWPAFLDEARQVAQLFAA
jgi:hypothetical protein